PPLSLHDALPIFRGGASACFSSSSTRNASPASSSTRSSVSVSFRVAVTHSLPEMSLCCSFCDELDPLRKGAFLPGFDHVGEECRPERLGGPYRLHVLAVGQRDRPVEPG